MKKSALALLVLLVFSVLSPALLADAAADVATEQALQGLTVRQIITDRRCDHVSADRLSLYAVGLIIFYLLTLRRNGSIRGIYPGRPQDAAELGTFETFGSLCRAMAIPGGESDPRLA